MTLQEGQNRLVQYVEKEIARSGFWIFFKRNIEISLTRVLEPYEKLANRPLPEKIYFEDLEIDKNGILYHQEEFLSWDTVCATGISFEKVVIQRHVSYFKSHLLVTLHSGEIVQFLLGDVARFKGLLGHFIELYKLENKEVV